jgi:hypothetical protein
MCVVYHKSNLYWRLDRWFNTVGFKYVVKPWAHITHRMLYGWVTPKPKPGDDRQCAREFLGKTPPVRARIWSVLNRPVYHLSNPLRMGRSIARWLFGGRNEGHWCGNCAAVYHPGIFERLTEGAVLMTGIPALIAWWYSVYEPFLYRRMRSEYHLGTLFNGPARVISVDGAVPLDPVYHGATKGEPLPEVFRNRYNRGIPPVMIPSRETILPTQPTLPEDMVDYQLTGRNRFFNRLVDTLPPIVFEKVTGAQIVETERYIVDKELGEGTSEGHMEKWLTITVLVGDEKVACGQLHNRRNGRLCWYKTRASARRAKSRFLIRKGLTAVPMEGEYDEAKSFGIDGEPTQGVKV